ncbi:MAG: MBL fold metallo-hydrolase [Clostridia bacterium]|nr:MBL fold metallo-hydrolase [Clostridia bacterium]
MEKLIQYRTKASLYDGAFDSTVGWAAAGMGYLIVTENGRLIAVDGGNAGDGEEFLALAEQYGGKNPVIEKWIITHPHSDHYGALLDIVRKPELAARLTVRELVYHFPEEFRDRKGNGIGYVYPHFDEILAGTGAAVHLPAVDEKQTVDGMTIHYLYTPTDVTILDNPNQLSLIFTVQGNGKKILFTGDAYHRTMQIAVWRYGNALKSDILQLPHHGLCDTGNMDFYKKADAKVVLIPISIAGDRTMRSDMYGDAPAVNRWAEDNADVVHKAFEGTVEIAL